MASPSCPTCKTSLVQAGYTERCPTCDGAWIHEDVLLGVLEQRASGLIKIEWQPRTQDRERGCAVCDKPMEAVSLGTVALDRCDGHGVWFDSSELAAVMEHAKELKTDEPDDDSKPQGFLGRLARRLFPVILIVIAISACGGNQSDDTATDDNTADSGDGVDASPSIVGDPTPDDWVWIEVPGTTCGNGSPAGFGINRSTVSDDLYIYFEGGGACWDTTTCYVTKTAVNVEVTYTQATLDTDTNGLVPDRSAAAPAIARATQVFVPYCTGDIHAGTKVATYDAHQLHHTGGTNAQAFVDALAARFPDAHTVWVAGSSAGGYGATLNFHRITAAWPSAETALLEDSSPFMSALANYGLWQSQWGFVFPPGCSGCESSFTGLFDAVVTAHPDSRIGLLHYDNDAVIRAFFGYGTGSLVPATNSLLTDHFNHANTKYFVLAGDSHTMIGGLGTLTAPDGTHLSDWVLQWSTGDAAWRSVR